MKPCSNTFAIFKNGKVLKKSNNIFIPSIGPGTVCNGSNYNDLYTCCTKEEPCDEWEGACNSNDQCMSPLACGQSNCDVTSPYTDYSGNQKFDCCYSGMYANIQKNAPRKRKIPKS